MGRVACTDGRARKHAGRPAEVWQVFAQAAELLFAVHTSAARVGEKHTMGCIFPAGMWKFLGALCLYVYVACFDKIAILVLCICFSRTFFPLPDSETLFAQESVQWRFAFKKTQHGRGSGARLNLPWVLSTRAGCAPEMASTLEMANTRTGSVPPACRRKEPTRAHLLTLHKRQSAARKPNAGMVHAKSAFRSSECAQKWHQLYSSAFHAKSRYFKSYMQW